MGSALTNIASIITILGGLIAIADWTAKRQQKHADEPAGRKSRKLGSLWTLTSQRAIAAAVGIVIYMIVYAIAQHGHSHLYGPVETVSLAQTTALVIGAWYGPWAGLVTAALGYPLTALYDVGSSSPIHFPFPPAYSVGDGLVGFVGGLICIYLLEHAAKTPARTLVVADVVAGIAVIIGDLISYGILVHQGIGPSGAVFLQGMRSDLVCTLVVLPLVAWYRLSKRLSAASAGAQDKREPSQKA